jgi:hypothetical protein
MKVSILCNDISVSGYEQYGYIKQFTCRVGIKDLTVGLHTGLYLLPGRQQWEIAPIIILVESKSQDPYTEYLALYYPYSVRTLFFDQ